MPKTFDRATLLRLDPSVFAAVALGLRAATPTDLLERAALDVPVAPTGTVEAGSVLEDARDPSRQYYLPRYELDYDSLRFRASPGGFELAAVLDAGPAPGPGLVALELPVTVTLTYAVGGAAVEQTLTFDEVAPAGADGLTVRYRGTSAEQRNDVLWALQHPQGRCRLTVQRSVTAGVGVQVVKPSGETPPIIDWPVFQAMALPVRPVVLEATVTAGALTPVRRLDPGLVLTALPTAIATPRLMPLLAREDGTIAPRPGLRRRIDDAGGLDPVPDPGPDPVPDPRPDPVPDPPAPPKPTIVTRYRKVDFAVASSGYRDGSRPLFYDPQADPEVFGGSTGGATRLVPVTVGGHVYLRRTGTAEFLHLPDELRLIRLSRTAQRPQAPAMTLSFSIPEAGADIPVTLTFAVVPWTDPARLVAARRAIAEAERPPFPHGADDVTLTPFDLASDQLSLTLRMAGNASGVPLVVDAPQTGLVQPFQCTFTVPAQAFQPAWAALAAGAGAVVTGSLAVRLDDAGTTVRLPFDGRFDRALAPSGLLDPDAAGLAADGTVRVRLTNGTESPLRLVAPTARVVVVGASGTGADDVAVVADVVPAAGTLPMELAPGDGFDAVLRPRPGQPALPAAGAPVISVEPAGLLPLVDPDLLYDAILDPVVVPVLTTTLKVSVLAGVFAADPELLRLQVAVEGDAVTVDRPPAGTDPRSWVVPGRALTARIPIKGYLLSGAGDTLPPDIHYRLRGIRPGPADPWSPPLTDTLTEELAVTEYRRPTG